jgi:hypothetical protein
VINIKKNCMRGAISKCLYAPNYNKLKKYSVKYHIEFHDFVQLDCFLEGTLHVLILHAIKKKENYMIHSKTVL